MADIFGQNLVGSIGNWGNPTSIGGSWLNSINDFLSNKAVLQALGTAGAAFDPKGAGGALGNLSNSWIAAKNQSKMIADQRNMLQELLAGGGNISLDGKGAKMFIPSTFGDGGAQPMQAVQPTTQSQVPQTQTSQLTTQQARQVNPFVSSQQGEIPLADLAGLTPENINQAMGIALGQGDLQRKSTADMYDALYKMGLLNVQGQNAQTSAFKAALANKPLIGGLSRAEFSALPSSEQEYLIYKESLDKGEAPMSRRDFALLKPTDKEKFIRSAMRNPEILKTVKDIAEAGSMKLNLGETIEKVKAVGTAKSELALDSPELVDKVKSKIDPYKDPIYTSNFNYFKKLDIDDENADRLAMQKTTAEKIYDRFVTQYGPDRVSAERDGEIIVIKVDGKIKQRIR